MKNLKMHKSRESAKYSRRFLLAACASPLLPADDGAKWNYFGDGSSEWGNLDPAFKACATGDRQSPVDLRDGKSMRLPILHTGWKVGIFKAVNNHHTIEFDAEPGSFLEVGASRWSLVQIHAHTPSEHAIDGQRTDMELHFVHSSGSGQLTVLAVRVVGGGKNDTFSALIKAAPSDPDGRAVTAEVDPSRLLPTSLSSSWRYKGSLTTPPCSQIVDWIVLSRPLSVDLDDIHTFQKLFPMNARPLQSLGGRRLLMQR